ncbi:MAG: hypothetical protein K1W15_10000 [Lachnospiraceae bacterium]
MECKYVAFVGTDSYDLVHFITRTAAVLGCHCLAVDRTKDLVLMQSLPDDCDLPLVDYRGVDFTCQETEQEAVEEIYDYVFFYYGFDTPVIPDIFEEVYCVIDYQKQNLTKMKEIKLPDKYAVLVLRDSNISKNYTSYVTLELANKGFVQDDVCELPFTQGDATVRLAVQYDGIFNFSKVSSEVVKFIVKFFSVDFKAKDVQKAARIASKGKGVQK